MARLEEVRLDGRVLGSTTQLALATPLAFGTAPALRAAAAEPHLALQEAGRSATSPRQRRAWSLIVGAEAVFALLLLVGSGLLIRSFWNIVRVDAGFRTDSTLAVYVALPQGRYTDGEGR